MDSSQMFSGRGPTIVRPAPALVSAPVSAAGGDTAKVRVHSSWAKENVSSFFCATLAPWLAEKKLGFWVVPSEDLTYRVKKIGLPGGDDGQDYELPQECDGREFWEEVDEREKAPENETLSDDLKCIYYVDVPDKKFHGRNHRKSFWLLPDTSPEYYSRNDVRFRTRDVKDGADTILNPPKVIGAVELASGVLFKNHLHALAVAILELSRAREVSDVLPRSLIMWAAEPVHVNRGQPLYYRP